MLVLANLGKSFIKIFCQELSNQDLPKVPKWKVSKVNENEQRLYQSSYIRVLKKRARLIQSLVFFLQDRLEVTNVNVQYVQLKETKRIPGKRI